MEDVHNEDTYGIVKMFENSLEEPDDFTLEEIIPVKLAKRRAQTYESNIEQRGDFVKSNTDATLNTWDNWEENCNVLIKQECTHDGLAIEAMYTSEESIKQSDINMQQESVHNAGLEGTYKIKQSMEKPFKCGYCDFSTRFSNALVKHESAHTGSKLYKCDLCNFTTWQPNSLDAHRMIHTSDYHFECDSCEFRTRYENSLKRHKRRKHERENQQCDLCEYTTTPVIWKRFLPNGPFSAFFSDFEIFNGPFLIILHILLWAIFQVNGTMAHGPLPSQSLQLCLINLPHTDKNTTRKNYTSVIRVIIAQTNQVIS